MLTKQNHVIMARFERNCCNRHFRSVKMSDLLEILTIDADIIAQQLTLTAADLYNKITLAECEAWQSLSPLDVFPEQTPHINAVIHHSNKLRTWILRMREFSKHQDRDTQAQIWARIVAIADSCLTLNNFSTVFSIISALGDDLTQRIHDKTRSRLAHLRRLFSPTRGFWLLRQTLRAASPPCVPFIGPS